MKGPDSRSGSAICQPMAREGAFHSVVDYLVLMCSIQSAFVTKVRKKVRGAYKRYGEATDEEEVR